MHNRRHIIVAVVLVLLIVLVSAVTVQAQPSEYSVPRWTVDTGGGRSSGGQYNLDGIAGQPDAAVLSSDKYTLSGGFWVGGVSHQGVYLPIIQR